MRIQRDNKLVTTEKRRNYFVSKPNYYSTELFTESALAIEMKKNWNTYEWLYIPVCLGLSILEVSEILMCEFVKKRVLLRKLHFENYKNCLGATQFIIYTEHC